MERNDGKIHIPARTKKYTNNNRAQIWISTEAYNAYCYRLGLRDGMHVQEGIAPEPAKMPVKATVKRTDKYDTILANIDAYDGTGKGQRVVK